MQIRKFASFRAKRHELTTNIRDETAKAGRASLIGIAVRHLLENNGFAQGWERSQRLFVRKTIFDTMRLLCGNPSPHLIALM
jgi:hypothetical protein